MKKIISFALVFCLVLAFAAFFISGRNESNNAYALGSDDQIIGSWHLCEASSEMYQFKNDGTCIIYNKYESKPITVLRYSYDAKNNELTLDDESFYCSVCGNGMILEMKYSDGYTNWRCYVRY